VNTTIRMPQWGMGITEAAVLKWHKHPGDAIEEGEVIADIETAKAVEELESPISGTVRELLVPEGKPVPVREPIAIVD
jgi:pyruvate/2-oxoglutarate dehydrogenase complex dihydrolipoamide acyltransferase (E2) component